MSGDFPYSVSGYQISADTGISLIHSGGHQVVPSQHVQLPSHLNQIHPPTQISHSQQTMTSHNPLTRLKVEDALSYLDRVKQQFSSTPNVYNEFLDIMKKFKAQSIDTPGVISHVSALFNGHPELMKGFNAFLPSGYKVSGSKCDGGISQTEQKSGTNMLTFEPQNPRQSPRVLGDAIIESPVSMGLIGGGGGGGEQSGMGGSQPVEFNHAINYVNKIKNRYQDRPDIYKEFLNILHSYQKEQKRLKESPGPAGSKTVSETDVFNRVSQLFKDQPDLLTEFSQFLPDAGISSSFMLGESESPLLNLCSSTSAQKSSTVTPSSAKPSSSTLKAANRRRFSNSGSSAPVPTRKFKPDSGRDGSLPDSSKYCTLRDFVLFDKIHRVLGDTMYTDFLRCLKLFNTSEMHITVAELMQMIQPFTLKMPELKKHIKELLKQKDDPVEVLPAPSHNKDRANMEQASTIDYNSCKVVGQSYRTLPRDQAQPTCSGRTDLCREVLNDKYVSCPSWSEDSSSVMKKLGAEESIFRCEDDRFQVDIVIANFEAAISALTFIHQKLSNMAEEEITKRYTDSLFALFSESLLRIAIRRMYEQDAPQVLDAMKKSPLVIIPVVLGRLREKAEEWRSAKERNSKLWNELNQKYYLKSLDHQGVNFKQTDTKQLRSKALVQDLVTIREDRIAKDIPLSPNLELIYKSGRCLDDAMSLIIHHVKRQSSIHHDEKQKIKQLLRHFIPDLFNHPRSELSDDDNNEDMDMENDGHLPGKVSKSSVDTWEYQEKENLRSLHAKASISDDNGYSLLYGNQNWYVFIRLHHILCDRLHQFYMHSERNIHESYIEKINRETSVAIQLGYRVPPQVEPDRCYSHFLDMVRNYLDGNIETVVYEEQLREMFTIHAYVAYTMDKLIQIIVRQLQYLVTDTISIQLTELFNSERMSSLTSEYASHPHYRSTSELFYQHKAEQTISGENYYKIVVYKNTKHVTIDQIVTEEKGSDVSTDRWSRYVEQFIAVDEPVSTDCIMHMKEFPVFVSRHLRRNKTTESSMKKTNTEEVPSLADLAICRFKINSFKMVYTTNTNTFYYKNPSRRLSPFQRTRKMERIRQKRVAQFTAVLNRPKLSSDWFLKHDRHNTIHPFPHISFCSNCHD